VSAPEQLAPSDLALLNSALGEQQAAQNVLNFVQAHLARTYGLQQGDAVRADGVIVRRPEGE
jgi:hypothetical protein